ncbi:MAG: segregation/condensation protein A [Clostridia bacterium]|nr:segregation/condensation protein A [Clostridia bacterium]
MENTEEKKEEVVSVNELESNNQGTEKPASPLDAIKLDKKSLEILEETEEDDYKFKLDQFEGPLDLLLHLIKVTKIDIRDIFLADITEQYLEMMKDIEYIDVEKASEFINMSATLLEIKSRHLLPVESEEIDEEDPEQRLIRQIEEYKIFKEQGEVLSKIEDVSRFYKAPDNSVGEFKYELPEKLKIDALINAFTSLMQKVSVKAEVVQEKKIVKDRFTVAQKISHIKDMLITKKEFRFKDLFEESYSKSEVINTFLALLELLKRQYITVTQNSLFDDIDIVKNEDIDSILTEPINIDYDGENN